MKPCGYLRMGWCNFIAWKQKCVVIGFLTLVSPSNEQFPMFPMPPPMMMMQANMPSQIKTSTDSPETNNNNNMAFAVPVPVPMPLQIAVPAVQPSFCAARPRPPACPPCPPCLCFPSCTPSFFSYCSPCHQKCRCTDGKEPPVPLPPVPPIPTPGQAFGLPMPMPMPPMPIMVPVPPFPRQKSDSDCSSSRNSDSSSESSEDSDDSDSSSNCEGGRCKSKRNRRKHRKHRKNRRLRKFRRGRKRYGRRSMANSDKTISIKPVLSFIDNRGDVKLKQLLNRADVRALTRDSFEGFDQKQKSPDIVQNVRLSTSEDAQKRPHILLVSDYDKLSGMEKTSQKREQRLLKQGKKELVFKPPGDKTITNLSVSFQVA